MEGGSGISDTAWLFQLSVKISSFGVCARAGDSDLTSSSREPTDCRNVGEMSMATREAGEIEEDMSSVSIAGERARFGCETGAKWREGYPSRDCLETKLPDLERWPKDSERGRRADLMSSVLMPIGEWLGGGIACRSGSHRGLVLIPMLPALLLGMLLLGRVEFSMAFLGISMVKH